MTICFAAASSALFPDDFIILMPAMLPLALIPTSMVKLLEKFFFLAAAGNSGYLRVQLSVPSLFGIARLYFCVH